MKNNKDLTRTNASDHSPQISRDTPVQYVKGVGPARAGLLKRLGIETLQDILFYFPWRYEDRRDLRKISSLKYGNHETVLC